MTPSPIIHVLVVSDIHGMREKVDALREWILSRPSETELPSRYDLAICLGDFADLMPGDSKEEVAKAREFVDFVLKTLKSVAVRVFYVPGNHDAAEYFTEFHDSNIHARNIEVEIPGFPRILRITGLGGSSDTHSRSGELIWNGYPYSAHEELGVAFEKTHSKLRPAMVEDRFLDIIMVHQGPSRINTSLYFDGEGETWESGNEYLYEYLDRIQIGNTHQLSVLLHGHTHSSWGVSHILSVPCINPGPLK